MKAGLIGVAGMATTSHPQVPPKSIFSEVMQRSRSEKLLRTDLHKELEGLRNGLVNGKKFNAQEILYYQIRFSEFHISVELLSKVAEGATATAKRFEQAGS